MKDQIEAGLAALNAEAAGLYAIEVFGAEHLPALLMAYQGGDERAGNILRRVQVALDQFSEPDCAKCCGACGNRMIGLPRRVALLQAERPDARATMAFGLCKGCADDESDAREAAIRTFKLLAPDARLVDVATQAGHA